MAKRILKGNFMYNDYYGYYDPSMTEDSDPSAEGEYQPAPNISEDWVNSQEYDPIMPLNDMSYESPSIESNYDSRRPGRPATAAPDRPAAVVPDRPAAVVPDRPAAVVPDRPVAPLPDRPGRPIPDRPGRPIPDRPVVPLPDRPGRPIPDRPVAPLPGRPGRPIPDRPGRPIPDRPVVPLPDRPGRPIPDRPPYRPITGSPVRPDWSWNWGFLLPGSILPSSISRVRFYNFAAREPIQIYVNSRLVASGLNHMNYTRFYNVAPGRYRITIYRSSNLRTPIVDTWISVLPNTSSTVTLSRFGNQFSLQTRIS